MSRSKAKPELKLVEDTGSQLQDEELLNIELPPQQSEMPFAVVEGEPVTQLPRDLYIPPDALQVFLTAFEGPLDLLLYLIRKQNLDILNIPIAEITRQYMQYIDVMADMQLELAGEYLLMAAMLAEIKSRMLLPRPATAEGTEEDDPRAELVRRLQEYERFKKAAEDIDRLKRLERDTMPASAELEEHKVAVRPPDVTLKEMLDAFRDVLMRAEKFAHHHISRERLSQRERMTEILARLQTVAFFEFTQLFKPEEGRMGVTVTFIAILELMKEGLIEIVQAEAYAPIHVRTAQRHLKVVQGGALAEAADAENVAALSQPELAGENDIPDEDDTPPADEAAVAVEAAVADVAAASSIAADSVESDNAASDADFVEAAVSEALASTENAVESVAADEAVAVDGAVIEEPAVEVPVSPEAAEEAIREDALLADERVDVDFVDVSAETSVPVAEVVEENVAPFADALSDDEIAATQAIEDVVVDSVDSHIAEEHVVEEHMVEELGVPEHVIEEHEVPAPSEGEQNIAQAEQIGDAQVADADVLVADEPVVGADATAFATESVVEAEVADVTNEAAIAGDTADAADEVVVDTASAPENEFAAEAEPAEIADEPVASADFTATDDVVEDAQPLEEVVVDDAPVPDTIEVVAEIVAADETTNVAVEDMAAEQAASVVIEDAAADEVTNVLVDDVAADEMTNIVMEHAVAEDTINVVVENAVADDTTNVALEHAPVTTEETSELSGDDDTVTGSSSEADNTDAEPSR